MAKTISVNLEVPIYKTVLNVIIADSVYKAFKRLDAHKECDWDFLDGANACFYISNSCHWILAFKHDCTSAGSIAHECFHAVSAIMRNKGVVFCEESEESFAYLLDYIVTEVNKIINFD